MSSTEVGDEHLLMILLMATVKGATMRTDPLWYVILLYTCKGEKTVPRRLSIFYHT
jgi:hypothetical protein